MTNPQDIRRNFLLARSRFGQLRGPPNDAARLTSESKAGATDATDAAQNAAKKLAAQRKLAAVRQLPASGTSKRFTFKDQKDEKFEKNQQKIKAYKELMPSLAELYVNDSSDISITERHNYFKCLPIRKKNKARYILNDKSITSAKAKVDLALRALGISYRVEQIPAKKGSMIFVELFCSLNPVFADREDLIYDEIIKYFQDML